MGSFKEKLREVGREGLRKKGWKSRRQTWERRRECLQSRKLGFSLLGKGPHGGLSDVSADTGLGRVHWDS